jgi:uncharacterized coiled-coil DUF342 family protein
MKGYRDEAGKVAKEIARLRSDVENGKLDIVEFARKQTELNNRINKYEEEFNWMGTDKRTGRLKLPVSNGKLLK